MDQHDCHHRIAVVSGYFNPLHVGHLRMMVAARELGEHLLVLVNNDEQQLLKKGRIIVPLEDRLEIVRALSVVDVATATSDTDETVRQSLRDVRTSFPHAVLVFANGGDRSSRTAISEAEVCAELDVELAFGVGGEVKADSSSRINAAVDALAPAGDEG